MFCLKHCIAAVCCSVSWTCGTNTSLRAVCKQEEGSHGEPQQWLDGRGTIILLSGHRSAITLKQVTAFNVVADQCISARGTGTQAFIDFAADRSNEMNAEVYRSIKTVQCPNTYHLDCMHNTKNGGRNQRGQKGSTG